MSRKACGEVFFVKTHWFLDTFVANYCGVGRFVISLADDIEIVDTPELVKYIQDFSTKHLATLYP